jgi:cytoskeletal protein CcmA (bactofilin family)
MFSKNRNKAPNRIDTLIGADTRIDGDIHFTGGLRVDGSIRGNVTESSTPSTLVLSESGRIEGAITVSQVVINGKVIGPVHALQFIELQAKSRVTGDVSYKSLEMHTGSVVEGKLVFLGDAATESAVDSFLTTKD